MTAGTAGKLAKHCATATSAKSRALVIISPQKGIVFYFNSHLIAGSAKGDI